MNKVLDKIPIWAYTVVLMVVAAVAGIFTGMLYTGLLESYGLVAGISPVIYVVFIGVAYGAIMRLVARLVYSLGDHIFFRVTASVPDYNLRRLPISYNSYVRNVMFWLIVAKLLDALFGCLLTFVYPVAYYLWRFMSSLALFLCLVAAYVCMDKAYVPAWQSGKCFLSLAIPAVVIYVLGSLL